MKRLSELLPLWRENEWSGQDIIHHLARNHFDLYDLIRRMTDLNGLERDEGRNAWGNVNTRYRNEGICVQVHSEDDQEVVHIFAGSNPFGGYEEHISFNNTRP